MNNSSLCFVIDVDTSISSFALNRFYSTCNFFFSVKQQSASKNDYVTSSKTITSAASVQWRNAKRASPSLFPVSPKHSTTNWTSQKHKAKETSAATTGTRTTNSPWSISRAANYEVTIRAVQEQRFRFWFWFGGRSCQTSKDFSTSKKPDRF